MKKRKNKPLEFMQCAVIAALCLPFLWVTHSYILAQQDKVNTLENLSMTVDYGTCRGDYRICDTKLRESEMVRREGENRRLSCKQEEETNGSADI
ncbi:hypothetical protein FACS1894219_00400 [Clostridia bacterium]|nr:hypothetical protein FACS1894219_00400 [Clostridia bacterium]